MKTTLLILCSIFWTSFILGQVGDNAPQNRVVSTIDSTIATELVLIQEFTINSPIDAVWRAYTTEEGWESWTVPMAEFDFKIGGSIKTNYNKAGKIGDSTTIVLHIVNYVPNKLITLQAEISDHFPEFMKEEAANFYNVICFDEVEKGKTKVTSYGIGYKNNPKFLGLLNFFIPANEMTFMQLIAYLEQGKIVEHE